MVSLNNDARIWLEQWVDSVIVNPNENEGLFKAFLEATGIEPTLETILGSIVGFVTGYIQSIYVRKFDRCLEDDEVFELSNLLKRRAWEVREAIMGTRIGKTCADI